jgi:predicted nucleic acid-binding protein
MAKPQLMNSLVDTNVLIDHLRNLPQATTYLSQARRQGRLWISAITIAEIYVGQNTRQPVALAKAKRLLQHFRVAYLDRTIAAQGGALARDFAIDLPDALIAATALHKGLQLVTRNTKHFVHIPNLNLHLPY